MIVDYLSKDPLILDDEGKFSELIGETKFQNYLNFSIIFLKSLLNANFILILK
jgi:hypothetical protein